MQIRIARIILFPFLFNALLNSFDKKSFFSIKFSSASFNLNGSPMEFHNAENIIIYVIVTKT